MNEYQKEARMGPKFNKSATTRWTCTCPQISKKFNCFYEAHSSMDCAFASVKLILEWAELFLLPTVVSARYYEPESNLAPAPIRRLQKSAAAAAAAAAAASHPFVITRKSPEMTSALWPQIFWSRNQNPVRGVELRHPIWRLMLYSWRLWVFGPLFATALVCEGIEG